MSNQRLKRGERLPIVISIMHTNAAFSGPAITVDLTARDLYRHEGAAEATLACASGSLWITLDHDPRDIVLVPGERWTAPANRRVIVYALEDAALRIAPVAEVRSSRTAGREWPGSRVSTCPA